MNEKQRILIVDDSEMNRAILSEMLGEDYEILEADNGLQAMEQLRQGAGIDLMLLDIMMPEMDGFEVLAMMNRYRWIEEIPVVMISAENGSAYVERAYDLGATDYISRPFDMAVVRRRVINTLMLYAKQKRLVRMVADQVYEKEKSNSLMINILSHIVEFRNGESGLHVLHIHTATDLLLRRLAQKTDRYGLTPEEISLISTASALHDIGKINIPEGILNKPGRLTPEEFEVMKTHTTIGSEILNQLPIHQEEPMIRVAYQICRWHHERYDGRGYPDGLKGDEIPIAAQVVALADVYDALTSERCYKKAFSHETALRMIVDGECGSFHPLLLECLLELGEQLQNELRLVSSERNYHQEAQRISEEMLRREGAAGEGHIKQALDIEREKTDFFNSRIQEIQFSYDVLTGNRTLSDWGAKRLNRPKVQRIPCQEEEYFMRQEDREQLDRALRKTTPQEPETEIRALLLVDGEYRWHRVEARSLWTGENPAECVGAVGRITDQIHQTATQAMALEREIAAGEMELLEKLRDYSRALYRDALTGARSRRYYEEQLGRLGSVEGVAMLDADNFKQVNDHYGHQAGDAALQTITKAVMGCIRSTDELIRYGGDEFLLLFPQIPGSIFAQRLEEIREVVSRTEVPDYPELSLSVSVGGVYGVSELSQAVHLADQAMYQAKQKKNRVCIYEEQEGESV